MRLLRVHHILPDATPVHDSRGQILDQVSNQHCRSHNLAKLLFRTSIVKFVSVLPGIYQLPIDHFRIDLATQILDLEPKRWLPRKPQTNWATLNVSLLSPCEFYFLAAGSFVIVLASYNSRHDTEHCWGFPAWMQELISKAFPKHCSNWPVVSPGLCGCVEQVAEGHPMVTAKDGLMWIESGMFQMFHILQLYTIITCKKWNLSGKTYFRIPKSPKISGEVPSHRFHLMAESIIIGQAFHQGLGILMPL